MFKLIWKCHDRNLYLLDHYLISSLVLEVYLVDFLLYSDKLTAFYHSHVGPLKLFFIVGLSDLNDDAVKTKFTDEGIEIRIENYKEIH